MRQEGIRILRQAQVQNSKRGRSQGLQQDHFSLLMKTMIEKQSLGRTNGKYESSGRKRWATKT